MLIHVFSNRTGTVLAQVLYTLSLRRKEGTSPRHNIFQVEQDNPDGVPAMGKPTARKAEPSSGCRKSQEANAGSRKAIENQ